MTWESRNLPHGPYYATYGGVFIGLTEGVIRHEHTPTGIPIRGGTLYGNSVLDEIYAGTEHFLSIIIKEWFDTTFDLINPFDTTSGATSQLGNTGVIGRSKWDLAGQIILTAVAGSPAATVGPVTRTYPKAILASDATVLTTFGVAERNIPLTFRILPQAVSDTVTNAQLTYFTETYS